MHQKKQKLQLLLGIDYIFTAQKYLVSSQTILAKIWISLLFKCVLIVLLSCRSVSTVMRRSVSTP